MSFSNVPNVVLEIDADSLEVRDSKSIKETILKAGLSHIFYGYAEVVLEKIGLLSSEDKNLAQIQVIAALAEYNLGRYTVAKDILVRLRLNNSNISEKDFLMASYIECSSDYMTGRIDIENYTKELKKLSEHKESKSLPILLRQSYLKFAIKIESDMPQRRKLFELFRDEVKGKIDKGLNKDADLFNEWLVLESEGELIYLEFSYATGQFILKHSLGFPSNLYEFYNLHEKKLDE
ncbi:MAG: hypothetical protein WA584_12110 [Pyrinomonadaceae bacterium]